MEPAGRVVVGVSGSTGNLAAVHVAARTAARTGLPLLVVNVWHPPGGELAARRSPCPPLDEACRVRARAILADALAGVSSNMAIERLILRGPTDQLLVAVADRAEDLLVVGTGRPGGLSRVVHGSVTRYCVAHARCPVLAVPPSDLTRDLTELSQGRTRKISASMDREGLRA